MNGMNSVTITDLCGDHASGEDRATYYLKVAAVLNDESPREVRHNVKAAAYTYTKGIVADLLQLAETRGLDLEDILKGAVSEFNDSAYRPIEITVKGAI